MDSDKIEMPIVICSRTARKWLGKLGFEYKNIRKDIFINGHEQADVVEDQTRFLQRMKELEPYMIEFEQDGTMKPKTYPSDCAAGGEKCQPIVVITHDESIFSANNRVCKAWTKPGDSFLCLKS